MARYDGRTLQQSKPEAHFDRRSYIKFLKGLRYGQKKAKRSRMLRQYRSSLDIQGMRATNP